MNDEQTPKSGKRNHQKLKPYVVLQILMQKSDEKHTITGPEIVDYLSDYGIEAEVKGIYRDIDEINKILFMFENATTIDEAEEVIDADTEGADKFIVYDKSKKGFYVQRRLYDKTDIRFIAECVYSSKFLSANKAKDLASIVLSNVSEYQRREIEHDVLITDRVSNLKVSVINNIDTLTQAMEIQDENGYHPRQKVSFNYTKYSIDDMSGTAQRRNGRKYVVSPYQLLLNDGNYYLLGFDDAYKKILTYRVDRMRNLVRTDEPRDGEEEFDRIHLKDYTQRVFGMFGGTMTSTTIRFINPLLDTVVDRFGKKGVGYKKYDDTHFTITTMIDISDQFYGWLCGFGKKAKILEPKTVADDFGRYVKRISEMYEE